MKLLKWSPFIFLGFIFIFVFWAWWEYWGVNIVRDMQCGPSKSISKPMAEAIVKEINRRGTPEKIVKLETLKNLPYTLVECEKGISLSKDATFETLVASNQTCNFYDDNQEYTVRLTYTERKWDGHKILKSRRGILHIYITKVDIEELDFTEILYRAAKYIIVNKKRIGTDEWNLFDGSQKKYSKKSKGRCKYKSPLRF